MGERRSLTEGSVFHNIVRFSLPFLLSYFLQTLYGMADLFIIGQYNGADVISAVSVGSQVMHMLTVMLVGLAMGTTVMIGRHVGAREEEKISRTIGNTIFLFLIIALALMGLLQLLIRPILTVLSTPAEAVDQARIYLVICFLGIPFITAYNVISAIFRGLGDSRSPMYFVAAACLINIVLDYVFIGAMDLHAAGAALGTVVSQAMSVLFALIAIRRRQLGIHVRKQDLRPDRAVIRSLLSIGAPICAQDGLIQISFLVITAIANRRGVDVAAAVGIVEKIISFLFLVPSAMLSTVSAIAAQNIGAGQQERAERTLRYGALIAFTVGVIFGIIFQFAARPVISLFTAGKDPQVIELGSQYIRTYVWDCALAGIHFTFSGFFSACGRSMISFIHNIIAIVTLRIPLAWLASVYFPATLWQMGIAPPAGSLLSALICIGVYLHLKKKGTLVR